MKVEVLFYISVPIVYWMIHKYGKNKVLISIIIFSLLYNYATRIAGILTEDSMFYTLNHQLPGELAYFYLPVLMLQHHQWVKRNGKALMWISFLMLIPFFFDARYDFLHPLCVPVFIVTFAYECKWLLFTKKWKDFSYEFYLFRFPIIQTVIFLGWGTTRWSIALIALLLIFIIAIPLHYLCKKISDLIG
jgi:peptidoglycan/LPS O-acetylase OafA/YrhL